MKTWEMYKYLTENPEGTVRNTRTNRYACLNMLIERIYDKSSHNYIIPNVHDKWEIVQKPVTFIEAMKALADGKCVFSKECPGLPTCVGECTKNTAYDPRYNVDLCPKEITHAKWYIIGGQA